MGTRARPATHVCSSTQGKADNGSYCIAGECQLAFAVLPRGARRLLDVLARAIGEGGGSALLSYDDLEALGTDRKALPSALRALAHLGLIEVGVGPRVSGRYSLATRWRSLDSVEAARLVKLAHEPRPSWQAASW